MRDTTSHGTEYGRTEHMSAKPELNASSDVCDLIASFVSKWCPASVSREFTEDLWTVVNFEKELCAAIADEFEQRMHVQYKTGSGPERGSSYIEGGSDVAGEIALRIRSKS